MFVDGYNFGSNVFALGANIFNENDLGCDGNNGLRDSPGYCKKTWRHRDLPNTAVVGRFTPRFDDLEIYTYMYIYIYECSSRCLALIDYFGVYSKFWVKLLISA